MTCSYYKCTDVYGQKIQIQRQDLIRVLRSEMRPGRLIVLDDKGAYTIYGTKSLKNYVLQVEPMDNYVISITKQGETRRIECGSFDKANSDIFLLVLQRMKHYEEAEIMAELRLEDTGMIIDADNGEMSVFQIWNGTELCFIDY